MMVRGDKSFKKFVNGLENQKVKKDIIIDDSSLNLQRFFEKEKEKGDNDD